MESDSCDARLDSFDDLFVGAPADIEKNLRELLPAAYRRQDKSIYLQILSQIALAQAMQNNIDGAHATLDQAQGMLTAADHLAKARIILERGRVLMQAGDLDAARPFFMQSYELCQSRQLDYHAANAAHMIAIAASTPQEKIHWNRVALELVEASPSVRAQRWRGSLYNNLGQAYLEAQSYDKALEALRKALRYREEEGYAPNIRVAQWAVARALRLQGRHAEALPILLCLADAYAAMERQGDFDMPREMLPLARGLVYEELAEIQPTASVEYAKLAYDDLSRDPWFAKLEHKRLQRLLQRQTEPPQGRDLAIHPPPPTGSCGIIHRTGFLSDDGRPEPHAPGRRRTLALDIWLPVSQPAQLVPYDGRALAYWREATFWSGPQREALEEQLAQLGEYLSPQGCVDVGQRPLPVVVFSHGFGAWANFYSYLIAELVSHGIAVVGINHTYNAGIAELPDGVVYGAMTHADLFASRYAEREHAIWSRDLDSVIALIKAGATAPYNMLDADRMVVMGQSFGGSLATQACCRMPQLKGCINLDGALFGRQAPTQTLSPLLILLGGDSVKSMGGPQANTQLAAKCAISLAQADDFIECYLDRIEHLASNNANVAKIILDDVDHLAFTDFVFLQQSKLFAAAPIGHKPPDALVCDIRAQVMRFLRTVLGPL